jgi:hypothetical protein
MVLDDKKIDDLLNGLMLMAKQNRANIPYSKDDAFAQVLVFLGPNFETAFAPAMWNNEAEKYHVMRGVSEVAKQMLCRAVVLISDTRWTNNLEVAEFLGLPPLKEIGLEAWGKQYSRILSEKYDGQLKNLPRQYWHEAIVIIMKGPELKGKIPMRLAEYERGPNDSIHWIATTEVNEDRGAAKFNLLPDWWC